MQTRYDSISVSPEGLAHINDLKSDAEILAKFLEQFPSRAGSIALTHLQTAVMFGVRAISENFPVEQSER